VARQVRIHRQERKFSYAELSRRLERAGRRIAPLGVRQIEEGTRRVDVDELGALCQALGINVLELLVPSYPFPAQLDGASDATKAIFNMASKENDGDH
jgi:transcriptional regulator with XRE-family HTH domain